MSILSSFVIRATGIPDKKYLRDPVIKRCYKRLSRRVPALMTGRLLCILGSGYVSMALEQPDMHCITQSAAVVCYVRHFTDAVPVYVFRAKHRLQVLPGSAYECSFQYST